MVFIFKSLTLRKYKPLNSSLRFRVNINKKILNLKKFKRLVFKKKNNSGRNSFGHITVRHKGNGLFNLRRYVDFFRFQKNEGNFISYDIDKKYSTFLALIKYDNGSIAYNLAANDLTFNQKIITTFDIDVQQKGITKPLGWIKNGSNVFNLELKPLNGGKLIRSAGTFGKILGSSKNTGNILIKLPSKKRLYFSKYCLATIGRSSNVFHFLKVLGKAGISRFYNIRPSVRGETMNPIDHPNGGRTRGGKPRKNPWGRIIK